MAVNGTFRSAINGFNRQDVMDYLESASQRYEALKKERTDLERIRTEQLEKQKELEAAQEEAAAQKEQAVQALDEAQEQLRACQDECETLRVSLEEVTAARDDAQSKVNAVLAQLRAAEETNARLTQSLEESKAAPKEDPAEAAALRAEADQLRSQLNEMESRQAETLKKANEYDTVRERIATLELNAVRRAADIEDTARAEAHALIEQAEQQAREIRENAQRDAEALLQQTREEEADFLSQREEIHRSFRESLRGAAQETDASAALLSTELQRLNEKLKGISEALTETALRFEPAEAPAEEPACEETPCCAAASPEEEPSVPAENPAEVHHCCHE